MVDMKIISRNEFERIKREERCDIVFGFHQSPFGKCLVGLFGERICHFSFVTTLDYANLNALKLQWPGCRLTEDEKSTDEVVKEIFKGEKEFFKVLLRGTPFERKVWEVLVGIPKGTTLSYEEVAAATGHDKAVRATANAVAKNFVAYLVPCHRVIRKNGSLHKYRWGCDIKRKILQFENSYL